jgi:DNA-binding MarR family transcriptional regulator
VLRPTMSAHVKRLEASGWILRAADAEDGRRSGLEITAAGLSQLEAVRRTRNDWLAGRIARLTPEEREKLQAAAEPLLQLLVVEP